MPVVRVDELRPGPTHILLRGVPEDTSGRGAGVPDDPAGVQQGDSVPTVLDQGAEPGLARPHSLLPPLPLGDVACDLGRADEQTRGIPDGGDRQRHVDPRAIPTNPDGFLVQDPLAPQQPAHDPRQVLEPVGRHDQGDVPADCLRLRPAVEPLCGRVPAGDRAIEGLADDGVVGRLDDGRQVAAIVLRPLFLLPETPPLDGTRDRRAEPCQPVLEQVVRGPLPHGGPRPFLAHRPRHDDDRDVQSPLADQPQGVEAAPLRERVIRQDHVQRRVEKGNELGLGLGTSDRRLEPGPAQLEAQQPGVVGLVFQTQYSDRHRHRLMHSSSLVWFIRTTAATPPGAG